MNTDSQSRRYLTLAPLCVGLILAVAVYWPGLMGTFFFDDQINILLREGVQLKTLSLEAIRRALKSGIAGPLGRPFSQLSFALNYYFSGFDPFAFKLTNLVIHCLNGILVYLIAVKLLVATRQKQSNEKLQLLAAVVAAAWLLHPIQLTSVLYVVQRMTSLSSLFLFAGVLLHISARENDIPGKTGLCQLLIAWLVFWPLSVLTKESGILFFGYVAAYELIIRRSRRQGLDPSARILQWLCIAILAGAAIYFLTPTGSRWLLGGYGSRSFTLTERVLTEPRVIWNYLGLIVFPRLESFALHHDDIAISTGLLKPWMTLPALLGIIGLVLSAWLARKHQPLLAFGIIWFLIAHSLESTVIALEIAHEHRNYVGLLGILLLAVSLFRMLDKRKTLQLAWASLMVLLLAYSGFITALRAHQYGNEIRRTQLESHYHPLSARSNYELAQALVPITMTGEIGEIRAALARKHYELTIKLEPADKMGFLGLMHLNCLTNRQIEPNWINELALRLEKSRFAPRDHTVMFIMKEMMIAQTLCLKNEDVHRLFNASIANTTVNPDSRAFLYSWLADYLILYEKNLPAAKQALSHSLRISPNNTSSQLKWAQLLFLDDRKQEALTQLKALKESELIASEKKTYALLLACTEGQESNCREMQK